MHKGLIFAAAILLWVGLPSCMPRTNIDSGMPGQAIASIEPPSELYGELFKDVQMQRVFPDSKTFPDAVAKDDPGVLVQRYRAENRQPDFDLSAFVKQNFVVSKPEENTYHSIPGQDVCSHIDALWTVLERRPDQANPRSSLLPLLHPYIVPGGRFGEIYYWDSYFTMLGLEESGRHDMALNMVRNFADLIDRHGHVPNGNRTYYLSRSQPPFFAGMVGLMAEKSDDPDAIYAEFLPAMNKEYSFWMAGADTLAPGNAYRRVVRLGNGAVLNRYWDDLDIPRDEAYREDVETAKAAGRPPEEVYRNLRAAAESGWDFSSRWLADGKTLSTIRTTELLPVDLNSLMFQLEMTLARASEAVGQTERANEFKNLAELRRAAIQRYLWDGKRGIFTDYVWREEKPSAAITGATFSPLLFGIATKPQAKRVAETIRTKLLKPGGLVTSPTATGQQWDAPNGWAPLQWIAIKGLQNYGQTKFAENIARDWMTKVIKVYRNTGKLMEKYNVSDPAVTTGGGEYPNQDGFGWTNGVLRKLLVTYPHAVAPPRGTTWCSDTPANDNVQGARPKISQLSTAVGSMPKGGRLR
jgi:alpha,alpha-trehalase